MLGGVLWIAAALFHASKPRGCVGDECAFRPMRESGPVDAILMLASLAFVAFGVWGVVMLARRMERFGVLGKTGIVLGAVGVVVLVVASLVQAVFFDGDFPLMPYLVIPGALALIAGIFTLGVAILRSRVLPRWAAALLVAGALAMLGFNEQTGAVFMAIPLGIAWMAVGYVLWSSPRHTEPRPTR